MKLTTPRFPQLQAVEERPRVKEYGVKVRIDETRKSVHKKLFSRQDKQMSWHYNVHNVAETPGPRIGLGGSAPWAQTYRPSFLRHRRVGKNRRSVPWPYNLQTTDIFSLTRKSY